MLEGEVELIEKGSAVRFITSPRDIDKERGGRGNGSKEGSRGNGDSLAKTKTTELQGQSKLNVGHLR